jgi:hypothetical protein
MVGRGPLRGPSNSCKRCNLGNWRHGTVVPVQLVRSVHEAGLLCKRQVRGSIPLTGSTTLPSVSAR